MALHYVPTATEEAFWLGYTDGLDRDPHAEELAIAEVRGSYLEGYFDGFYERKQREQGSARGLVLAVSMVGPRSAVLPLWKNYTRETS